MCNLSLITLLRMLTFTPVAQIVLWNDQEQNPKLKACPCDLIKKPAEIQFLGTLQRAHLYKLALSAGIFHYDNMTSQ